MREDVGERLVRVVAEKFNVHPNELHANSSLRTLQADSLDAVELLIAIECEFDIDVPDEDAEQVSSFDELAEYVCSAVERDAFDRSAKHRQKVAPPGRAG